MSSLSNAELIKELISRWIISELMENPGNSSSNDITQILSSLDSIRERQDELKQTVEEKIMAKLTEVLTAIEDTGMAIIQTVNDESSQIVAKIEEAKAGASEADFNEIIASVKGMGAKVTDAVAGLVPTIESPVEPTPIPEPTPVPTPETPVETPVDTTEPAPLPTPTPLPPDLPDLEVPVDIEPSPDGTGVDGGANIDLTPQ